MKEVSTNVMNMMKTTVEKDPSGLIFDFTLNEIEEYVEKYLTAKGVDKVDRVVAQIVREGSNNIDVSIYVFMNPNSNMIVNSTANNIIPALRNKMELPTVISNEFKEILAPLCVARRDKNDKEDEIKMVKYKNSYYIVLDPIRVLALMLGVRPQEHAVYVIAARRFGKSNGTLRVTKQMREYNTNSTPGRDRFESLAFEISSGRR